MSRVLLEKLSIVSAVQEIPRNLYDAEVHCHVCNNRNRPHEPDESSQHPSLIILMSILILFFDPSLGFPNTFPSFKLCNQIFVYIYIHNLPNAFYTHLLSYLALFNHRNYINISVCKWVILRGPDTWNLHGDGSGICGVVPQPSTHRTQRVLGSAGHMGMDVQFHNQRPALLQLLLRYSDWSRQASWMRVMRSAYKTVVTRTKQLDVKESESEGMDWICLARDSVEWLDFLNTGNLLTNRTTASLSRIILLY
jgi:hypothetical protein